MFEIKPQRCLLIGKKRIFILVYSISWNKEYGNKSFLMRKCSALMPSSLHLTCVIRREKKQSVFVKGDEGMKKHFTTFSKFQRARKRWNEGESNIIKSGRKMEHTEKRGYASFYLFSFHILDKILYTKAASHRDVGLIFTFD